MSDKRVRADICPICDGAVLAPESLHAHLRDEHAHHPCLYPGCTVPGHVEPITFEEAQQYGREAEAADRQMQLAQQLREAEALLDRIEQRAALSPLGFDSHADRKTLRLQGVMFAHWISEQRAEMVLAESRLTGQGGAEPPAARALLHTEAEAGA